MGQLIDDLLEFSRMNRQNTDYNLFSMNSLVEECIEEVQKNYPDTNPSFNIDKLPDVNAGQALIRQVLINIIGNAVKYRKAEQDPEIAISVEVDGGRYIFSVKDNGVGFDMKYADKLFGVFQRLHSNDEFEGTGIGLALVKRIIARHGGDTWAESHINEGTTIYFTLPLLETTSE